MKKTYLLAVAILSLSLISISANAQLGQLWGTTEQGGVNGGGVLYYFDPQMGKDSVVYNFPAGASPEGTPVQAKDGALYGVTQNGGTSSLGSIYKFDLATWTFSTVASFNSTNGKSPNSSLIQAAYDGNLYGVTGAGGSGSDGVIFQFNPTTTNLSAVFNFAGANGNLPVGGLVEGSGGVLYGTTTEGGGSGNGSLFKFFISSSTLNTLHNFAGPGTDGATPIGYLTLASDGNLYGMTQAGGNISNDGIIYKYIISGSTYSVITNFSGSTGTALGANPQGGLISSGTILYGLTFNGGINSYGEVFKCSTGGGVTDLYDFQNSSGGNSPKGNLCLASDGNLYGVTYGGGANSDGVLFKCTTAGVLTNLFPFNGITGKWPSQGSSLLEVFSVNIRPVEPTCGTQNLNAMPRGGQSPYTYNWSTGATTSSISTNAAGTYTISVTDNRGIVATSSITLAAFATLSASVTGTNVTCYGNNDGTATAVPSGGDGPYTFSWSNSMTTGVITGLSPAGYTVTITDNSGCTAGNSYTVTQPATALSIGTSGNPSMCSGSTSVINASGSGGTLPYSYTWSPAATLTASTGASVTSTATSSVTYTVTVTDANNCTAVQTFSLTVNPQPAVTASSNSPVCAGSTLNLSGSGAGITSWVWNGPNSFSAPLQNPSIASVTTLANGTYTLNVIGTNGCSNSTTTTATVNSLPIVTANAGSSNICNGSSTSLTTGGANTYTWSPSTSLTASTGLSVTATPTISTTYTVTGTSASGCVNTATVSVTVNPLPPVAASAAPASICSGGSSVLTGSGANTYTWAPSASLSASSGSSVTSTPAVSTTYTITGTSVVGCVNTSTVSVTLNSLPTVTASAGSSPICAGSTSLLTANGASTYTWSPSSTLSASTGANVTATPTISVTYTVTGTSAVGCVNTGIVSVAVNALPNMTGNASPSAICTGGFSTLTTSGANTYAWSPSTGLSATTGASVVASPSAATTYTVIGTTSATGCQNTKTIPVGVNALPNVTASAGLPTICSGTNTSLTASGASTYTWIPSTGLSATTGSGITAMPASNTTYTVTGTDVNGCQNTQSVPITVNSSPVVTASASMPTICVGGNSTLSAGGANTYTWSPSTGLAATTGSSVLATPTVSTTYTVTGTNGTGCQNTKTVIITVNSLPVVTASAGTNTLCAGSNTNLTTSGANTYIWSPATGLSATTGTSVTAMPASSVTYTVTGTDGNGCQNIQTVPITVNPLPSVGASAGLPTICLGNGTSLTASGAATYVWSPSGSLSASTGANVTATPSVSTTYTVTGTDVNGCQNTKPVSVTVDAPSATLEITNASCFGVCNGTALPNVTGGSSPYTYNWSNGQTGNIAYGLCATTYTFTLKDVIGCSSTQSFTINQPAAISLSASPTATTCGLANGTATATPTGGSAPYNYSWNTKPVQTGAVATGLAAGSYTVALKDGNGCGANTTVTVAGSSGPGISSTNVLPSSCGASNGKASIVVTGGASPYKYSWNNGDTIAVDSNLSAGTYIATVTDKNGCSTFEAVIINDASGPAINVNSVNQISCYGASSGSISVGVTGGTPPYQYVWSNSATTQNISGLTAGPYQFTVSDANNCTAVQTVDITQPNQLLASADVTEASCGSTDGGIDLTASGGATPYSYAWNTGGTTSSISSVGAGTYSVTVTDNNGCSTVLQASISNTTGPLVTVDSVVNIGCSAGTAGEVTTSANGGTPPYTYLWSNGATTANIYGLSAGNYALTVTDASGCAGTANATITQSQLDPISICMVTVDPATNFNNLIWDASTATGGIAKYNIYKETTSPGVFNKIGSVPAGTGVYVDTLSDARKRSWRYELSQVDSCGNESSLSQPFKTMHLTINLGAGNAINLIWDNFQGITFNYYIVYRDSVAGVASDSIDYVTNNGIFTYTDYPPTTTNWYYHMGISGSAACSPSIEHGTHSVESINYNASKSNTGNVTFVGPTSVANIASLNSVDIYPNPNTGMFNLAISLVKGRENIGIRVLNMMGQVLWNESYNNVSGDIKKQIDLSAYSKGIYLVQITTDEGIMYRRVTIQ